MRPDFDGQRINTLGERQPRYMDEIQHCLSLVQKVVVDNPGEKLQLVRIDMGPLRICKQIDGQEVSAISDAMAERWMSAPETK